MSNHIANSFHDVVYVIVQELLAWFFRQNLIHIHLLKEIERLKCITKINKLELKPINSNTKNSINNNIIVPPNGIYHIKNLEISCIIGLEDI